MQKDFGESSASLNFLLWIGTLRARESQELDQGHITKHDFAEIAMSGLSFFPGNVPLPWLQLCTRFLSFMSYIKAIFPRNVVV